jgi:hypothetical protein
MTIRIIGLNESRDLPVGTVVVNTTSRSKAPWSIGLSPFKLGPVPLYVDFHANCVENAWQFSKVYPDHLNKDDSPSDDYWTWANAGWKNPDPVRYPRGKGAKPAYCLWDGERLGYIDARLGVYFPLYRDAVASTLAYTQLEELYAEKGDIVLFDFDGYDHDKANMSLSAVLHNGLRPMGHAFVLKAMLLFGKTVTVAQINEACHWVPPKKQVKPVEDAGNKLSKIVYTLPMDVIPIQTSLF